MSCWVVPNVAADLWGISLEDVLESIRLGRVPSRQDCDFMLVDVAPDSPQIPAPQPYKPTPPAPPTFALHANESDSEEMTEADADEVPLNFQTARTITSQTRQRPPTRTAA